MNINTHSTTYLSPNAKKLLSQVDVEVDQYTETLLKAMLKSTEKDTSQIKKALEKDFEVGVRYSTMMVPPDIYYRIPDGYTYNFRFLISTNGKEYVEVQNRHQLDKTKYDSLFVKLISEDLKITIGPKVIKDEFIIAAREKIKQSVKHNISSNVIEFLITGCRINQNWMIDSYAKKLTLKNLRSSAEWELDLTKIKRKDYPDYYLCLTPHVDIFKLYPGDKVECTLIYEDYENIMFQAEVENPAGYGFGKNQSEWVELKPFHPEQNEENPIFLISYNETFKKPLFKVSNFFLIRGCSDSSGKIKKILVDVDGQGLVELDWQFRSGFDLPINDEVLVALELASGERIGPFKYQFDLNEVFEAASWNCDEPRLEIQYDHILKSKVATFTKRLLCLKDVQKITYGINQKEMNKTIDFNMNIEKIIETGPKYNYEYGYERLPRIKIPENMSDIYYQIVYSDGSKSAVIRLPVK